jgi:4'-phosphopantetheinyl transferase EntD
LPLFYQHTINENTKLAVWKIDEDENFFLQKVPLQTNIPHAHKRLQHLAARYLLRFLFADFPNEEILIADTRKPFLPSEQYHFSISHCGNFAAAIVSKNERVGIDIEIPSEKTERIQKKFLNKEELIFINKSSDQKIIKSTIAWCVKETVFKWWSFGNVDFKKNILLQNFLLAESGKIEVRFKKENENISLSLNYQLFEGLCLVWVSTNLS